ncbi:MAG: hypothetical protein RI560_05675 [Natronomonas sp.]|nr:hypothetical protein [Natronomonas sp.]
MRGLATAILVGFVSVILFVLVGPAIVEPIVDVVVNDPAVQNSQINGAAWTDSMLTSLFVWAPLFVLGAGVASGVVWYFRKERVSRRVR